MDPDGQQNARSYLLAVLAFSLVSIAGPAVAILMGQAQLPFSRGLPGMGGRWRSTPPSRFVTNTNWQSYAGESTLGYTAQTVGLAVQNFVSAAVGIAVAAALMRGFAARQQPTSSATSGSIWSGSKLRLLLPLSHRRGRACCWPAG